MSGWNENSDYTFGANDLGNMGLEHYPEGSEIPISECWYQIKVKNGTRKEDKDKAHLIGCPGRKVQMEMFKPLVDKYVEMYIQDKDKFVKSENEFTEGVKECFNEGIKKCKDVGWQEHIEVVIDAELYKRGIEDDNGYDADTLGWGSGY